jgi:hypothetical protein
MFSVPTRCKLQNEDGYCVMLNNPVNLNVSVQQVDNKYVVDNAIINTFQTLRTSILESLCNTPSLFRTPPNFANLDIITPPWGFVKTAEGYIVSPYTKTIQQFTDYSGPVNFILTKVYLSRSCIMPEFNLEKTIQLIDLMWETQVDIEEVDDIPSLNETFTIVDPALKERMKAEEKAQIRNLFIQAERSAVEWMEKYDVSETESTFTEWMKSDDEI